MGDVVDWGGITRQDIPVDRVLSSDEAKSLETCLVIGWDQNEELFFATSTPRIGDMMILLELTKQMILDTMKHEA